MLLLKRSQSLHLLDHFPCTSWLDNLLLRHLKAPYYKKELFQKMLTLGFLFFNLVLTAAMTCDCEYEMSAETTCFELDLKTCTR